MTCSQLAGKNPDASEASLPAATTTATPAFTASSIAAWVDGESVHRPRPPKLILMTFAGWGLFGTPGTGRPAAHRMPSLMSAMVPPHLPSTRTACTFTLQFTPATPTALLVPPIPTVPATCVPCQLAGRAGLPGKHSPAATPSPGSVGSPSRPSPSFALARSVTISKPPT